MQPELFKARESLRNKLLRNAEFVMEEVLKVNLDSLIEIGLFGSLVKNKFTCNSDADIYLLFEGNIPDRQTKGLLRSISEENNCDIVFINEGDFISENAGLLVNEILKDRIILWRRVYNDPK